MSLNGKTLQHGGWENSGGLVAVAVFLLPVPNLRIFLAPHSHISLSQSPTFLSNVPFLQELAQAC